MRLFAISGSLRARSSNAETLRAAALLAPAGVAVTLYDGLAALPAFNPDLDTPDAPEYLPAPVAALRAEIACADGLLISSPEYAHGVAGALKNALDWLVGSLDFAGTPVAVINAAPRAVLADAQLREILATMAARLVEPASIAIPVQSTGLDAAAIAAHPALAVALRDAMARFCDAVAAP